MSVVAGTSQAETTSTESSDGALGKLPLWLCMGWGIGTLGMSVMFNSVNLLLSRFATDYLGIAASTFGLIYFVSKIYDAVTDPTMGWLSDRTKSRFGRRRPYLLLGGAISAIAFICIFNTPSIDTAANAAWILALGMILYSTGYTVFNVPYLSMPVEMTNGYLERARLISFRVYAIGIGSLIGLSLAPTLIPIFGSGKEGHAVLSVVFGGVIFSASVLCFLMTRNARATEKVESSSLSRRDQFRLILSNKPFLVLVGVKFMHLASLAITQAAFIYFVVYVLEKGYVAVGMLGLANAIGMLVGTPIWYAAARKLRDKRTLYMIASALAACIILSWWFATPAEPMAITMLRKLLHGIATAGSLLFGQSMLPDAIAHDAKRSGLRREGVFSGIFTTAEKTAFAVGGALTGIFLGAMGYVSSTSGSVAQPESAILAVYICQSILPALMLFLSILLLTQYNLSEDEVEANSRQAGSS